MYFHRKGLFLLLLVFLISGVSFAQDNVSVYWSLMIPDSQNVSAISGDVTGLKQTGSPGFVVRDYANGPGPDQRWWPYDGSAAVSWGDETAQVDERWVQFALYPNSGFNFNAEQFSVYIGAKGTNAIRANIYYSTNSSFIEAVKLNDEELPLLKDTDSLYSFTIGADVAAGDTFFVRIYPWYT